MVAPADEVKISLSEWLRSFTGAPSRATDIYLEGHAEKVARVKAGMDVSCYA